MTYACDGFNCISEILNLQSVITTTSYVWGNDISGSPQSAGGVGGLVAVLTFSPQPSAFYPLFDARGNITAYTDSSGSIAATFDYLPFGALASSTGNANAFSYRFSTKPFDPETGLVYYNFRYYSPELGRWMSRDPEGERGRNNLYEMVGNDALSWWDWLGLARCCIGGVWVQYSPITQCCRNNMLEKRVTDSAGKICCESELSNIELRERQMHILSGDIGHSFIKTPHCSYGFYPTPSFMLGVYRSFCNFMAAGW